jgi:hypothetical protein
MRIRSATIATTSALASSVTNAATPAERSVVR